MRAAITVNRSREDVEGRWRAERPSELGGIAGPVTFRGAPGERGTEIHVEVDDKQLAKAKDGLRRFKQLVEVGEIVRSESAPEAERMALS